MKISKSLPLLAVGLLVVPISFLAQAQLDDARGTTASTAVQFLIEQGIVEGYDDGSFKPDQEINRAEFLKLVIKSADKAIQACDGAVPYSDVAITEWWAGIICTATDLGIVEGYPDGTFRPSENINLAEASKIVAKVNELETEVTDSTEAWYQQFIRALQGQKAIANSIKSFAQQLNRGEMAQMVWGLSTGNEVNEAVLDEALPKIASCDMLETEIKRFQKRQGMDSKMNKRRGMAVDFMMAEPAMMEMEASMADDAGVAAPAASQSVAKEGGAERYSETNVQEFGVDEADIIKNDGQYIYLIKNDTIKVVEAFPPENMKTVATIKVDEKGFYPREMYVDGDTLSVIGQSNQYYAYDKPLSVEQSGGIGDGAEPLPEFWEDEEVEVRDESGSIIEDRAEVAMVARPDIWPGGGSKQMTTLVAYDISNRAEPKVRRTVSVEGNYQSSRKIGEVVYLVSNKNNNWYWGRGVPMNAAEDLPTMRDSADEAERLIAPCQDIYYYPNFETANYLTVAAVDTVDVSEKVGRIMMLGSGEQLYSSAKNMYVTRTRYDDRFVDTRDWSGWRYEPTTHIYKFALDDTKIDFTAKGTVRGRVLNQFSMSEAADGHFRIATQTDGEDGSMMTILNKNLVKTGNVDGIAPGENIKSVRFMGDKAYLITFKNVDPLFVIDLDPQNPKVLGELKIPGWSDYLHPYDDDHLIGIGREVKEGAEADGRLTQDELLGLKLSIFDVSDLNNPKEIHKKVIGDNGTSSEATSNHKAFLFDAQENVLALPITVMQQRAGGDTWDRDTVFQGAFVYDVDLTNGFVLRGKATHYDDGYWSGSNNNQRRYGNYEYNVQRILYLGDYWYTVAQNVIAAYNWGNVSKVRQIELEAKPCNQIYDEYQCGQADHCRAIWREWSECYTDDEDFSKICEEEREFSRCEKR